MPTELLTIEEFLAWLRAQANEWEEAAKVEAARNLPLDAQCFTPSSLDDWLNALWSHTSYQKKDQHTDHLPRCSCGVGDATTPGPLHHHDCPMGKETNS